MKPIPTTRRTALVAGLALLAACAQVSLQDEAVTALRIEGPVDLVLEAGEKAAGAEPKGLRRTREGHTLVLSADPGQRGRLAARLPLPAQLSRLSIAGGADVALPELQAELISLELSGSGRLSLGRLRARQLLIDISGSGDLRLGRVEIGERAEAKLGGSGDLHIERLRAPHWQASLHGSGAVHAAGWAGQQQWRLSGSGGVHAGALDGQHLELACWGSGDSQLGRSERLLLRLYGSGDVAYAGEPALQLRQLGSGSARSRGS